MLQVSIQQAFTLAVQHHQAGRLNEAEQIYRQILDRQPNHAGALRYLGVLARQAGRSVEAVELIRRSIAIVPNDAAAHSSLGNALKDNGQLDEAIGAWRQAIALKSDFAEAHFNLGNGLKESGQLSEAITAYQRAVAIKPDYAEAYGNLGVALKDNGLLNEAIAAYRRAIAIRPDLAENYSNLGNVLWDKGQFDEAIAVCRHAIALEPHLAEAHCNLGNALKDKGQLDEAIDAYRQAMALKPNLAEAPNNLGNALKDQGQLDEAIAAYRQAMAVKPDYAEAHSNLVYTLHFHPAYDAPAIFDELRRWNDLHARPLSRKIIPHDNDRSPNRRLRIGYVSPDFRRHVVGQSVFPIIREHDRSQFEIFCYSNVRNPDDVTDRFREKVDHWRSIHGMSDPVVAEMIRQDRIDILVDLALHMSDGRPLVFARKPAPIQVTYLGYCGSTGMEAVDYRFSDPYLDPKGTDHLYAEKTMRLPTSYWCYQSGEVTPEIGAPPDRITFGCLNNFCKINHSVLDLWQRILNAVPQSRLIIHSQPGRHLDAIVSRFARNGIEADRLEFVGMQSYGQYLATYQRMDIALDPFPYCGGITTCDSLWMGVPVVTLTGDRPVARAGRTLLSQVGLQNLIANRPDEYVQIAVGLANDRSRLNELRRSLRDRMKCSPLMDAVNRTKDIETAYRRMWRS